MNGVKDARLNTMQNMLLTFDELVELTDYQIPAKQIQWLQSHGWNYEIGASGRPKVSRSYAESRLGMIVPKTEPDFSFLTKAA